MSIAYARRITNITRGLRQKKKRHPRIALPKSPDLSVFEVPLVSDIEDNLSEGDSDGPVESICSSSKQDTLDSESDEEPLVDAEGDKDLESALEQHADIYETRFKAVLEELDSSSISVKRSDWDGSVASNLIQIRRGDLYVDDNHYTDAGGDIRVVSASQLEAIHSKLRKLLDRVISVEVGLWILDIFILQHNLSVGPKDHRNPLPEPPQLEYMSKLLAMDPLQLASAEKYRATEVQLEKHRPWEKLFAMIQLRTSCVEDQMFSRHEASADICVQFV
ncbi:hypothetical protein V7S43_018653 [Phytophthora oleae]|uniref:Uncharacterized protein n=1 Tax=Phytophthora oleae TaxID=2107226 RepID=A0ABD3EQN1_9STRA